MRIIVNGFVDYSLTDEEFHDRILHHEHKGANTECPVTLEYKDIKLQLTAEDWAKAKILLDQIKYC